MLSTAVFHMFLIQNEFLSSVLMQRQIGIICVYLDYQTLF
jgi:hypothetical protein